MITAVLAATTGSKVGAKTGTSHPSTPGAHTTTHAPASTTTTSRPFIGPVLHPTSTPAGPSVSRNSEQVRLDAKKYADSYGKPGSNYKYETVMRTRANTGDVAAQEWMRHFNGYRHANVVARNLSPENIERAKAGDTGALGNIRHHVWGYGAKSLDKDKDYMDPAVWARIQELRGDKVVQKAANTEYEDTGAKGAWDTFKDSLGESVSNFAHGVIRIPGMVKDAVVNICTNPKKVLNNLWDGCVSGYEKIKKGDWAGAASGFEDTFFGLRRLSGETGKTLQMKENAEQIHKELDKQMRLVNNLGDKATTKDRTQLKDLQDQAHAIDLALAAQREVNQQVAGSTTLKTMSSVVPIGKGAGTLLEKIGVKTATTSVTKTFLVNTFTKVAGVPGVRTLVTKLAVITKPITTATAVYRNLGMRMGTSELMARWAGRIQKLTGNSNHWASNVLLKGCKVVERFPVPSVALLKKFTPKNLATTTRAASKWLNNSSKMAMKPFEFIKAQIKATPWKGTTAWQTVKNVGVKTIGTCVVKPTAFVLGAVGTVPWWPASKILALGSWGASKGLLAFDAYLQAMGFVAKKTPAVAYDLAMDKPKARGQRENGVLQSDITLMEKRGVKSWNKVYDDHQKLVDALYAARQDGKISQEAYDKIHLELAHAWQLIVDNKKDAGVAKYASVSRMYKDLAIV